MAIGQALLLGATAAAFSWHLHPAVTLGLIAISAVVTTPLFPAIASSLPHLVSDDDVMPAGVIVNGVETLSWVIGPAVGGGLLVFFDPVQALIIGAAVSLAAIGSIPRRVQPTASEADRSTTAAPDDLSVLAGLEIIATRFDVAAPLLLVVIANMLNGAEGIGLVLVSEELLGTGSAGFGLLSTSIGAGGVLGIVVSKRLASSRRRLRALSVALLLSSLPMALLAVTGDQRLAIALVFIAGASSVATEVAALSIVLELLPPSLIGRVFGIVDSLLVASMLLGALAMPATITLFGLRAGLVIIGTVGPLLVIATASVLGRRSAPTGASRSPDRRTSNRATPRPTKAVEVARSIIIDPTVAIPPHPAVDTLGGVDAT